MLTEQEQQSLAHVAKERERIQAECDRANEELERLREATDETLVAILRDSTSSSRHQALAILIQRRPPSLDELILPLIDDPEEQVWMLAIQCAPNEPAVNDRLHELYGSRKDYALALT
jgi:hypothetical protein